MADHKNSKNKPSGITYYTVDHDKNKCALCVVCARNCPTGALRRNESEGELSLYFNASLCDGCGGDALCEKNCPEKAIVSVSLNAPPESNDYVLLNRSEMVKCAHCEELFAPTRRLEIVGKRAGQKDKNIEQRYCPLCRRTNLVVEFIEEHRAPGSKAEYRSATDIIRRVKSEREKARED